ncbi:MAG: CDP-alcohol phosphatidyltransferase family protein [Alphaproteobacteria bacterium]|nr:CDP-alcohol phosphatidyltransferase family protein [Alphaproteobacteria bacterium]
MNFAPSSDGETDNAQGSIDAVSSLLMVLPPGNDGPVGPETELLGMPLARRTVRTAERAGFERIITPSDDPAPTMAARRIVVLSGDVLPDQKWLQELLHMPVEPGKMIFEAGTAAVIETTPGQRPFSLHSSSQDEAGHVFATLLGMFDASSCRLGELGEQRRLNLTPETTVSEAVDWLLGGLVKETDGVMARLVSRPISLAITRRIAATRVSANAMTIISILVGLLGAPFFLSSQPALQVTGALLFLAHSILDGCDGELARLRMKESRLGGILDYWGDNLVHVAVFACMGVGWSLESESIWPLWAGFAAVLGTLASAGFVFWRTMRHKESSGPLFTSVAQGPGGGFSQVADALARRDFIYLVVLLSAFGKAAWFLALTAVGAPVFFIFLLVIAYRETN